MSLPLRDFGHDRPHVIVTRCFGAALARTATAAGLSAIPSAVAVARLPEARATSIVTRVGGLASSPQPASSATRMAQAASFISLHPALIDPRRRRLRMRAL